MIFDFGRRSNDARNTPRTGAGGQPGTSPAGENDDRGSESELVDGSTEGRDAAAGLLVGAVIGAVLWVLIYFLFD
jgi:hypothetical protein